MTYGGQAIFGTVAKMIGPSSKYRAMRRYLPGVDGFRTYRLGKDGRTWRVRGRLTSASRTDLELQIYAGGQLVDGQLRYFVGDGATYPYVMMESYEPGPIQRVTGNATITYTCVVDATFTQAAP